MGKAKKKSQLTASSRLAFLINIIIICLSNYAGRKSIKTHKKVRFRVSVWIRATIYSWPEANSMFYTHVYINNNNQKKKKVGPFALLYQFFFFLLPAGNCSKKRCRANSSRYTKTEWCPRSELHKYSDDLCFLFLSCFFLFLFLRPRRSLLCSCSVCLVWYRCFAFFFSFLFSVFFFPKLLKMNSLSCIFFFFTTLYWQRLTRQRSGFVTLVVVDFRTWQTLRNRGAKKKKKKEKRVRLVIYEGCRNTYASKKKKTTFSGFLFFFFTFSFFVSLALSLLLLSSFFSSLREVTLL